MEKGPKALRKMQSFLHFLAFGFFDHNFGVPRGERLAAKTMAASLLRKPARAVIRPAGANIARSPVSLRSTVAPCSQPRNPLGRAPRLGSSGTFLVLFWSQKSPPIGQNPTKKGRCRKVATPVKHKQKTKINPNKSPWPLQHSTCRNRPAHRGSCPPHPPKDLRSHGG